MQRVIFKGQGHPVLDGLFFCHGLGRSDLLKVLRTVSGGTGESGGSGFGRRDGPGPRAVGNNDGCFLMYVVSSILNGSVIRGLTLHAERPYDEKAFIAQLVAGDENAFKLLFERFSGIIFRLHFSFAKTIPLLENFLVTGMYPEVITHPENAIEILTNLAGSYLYKDILEISGVRRPDILLKLLQALAWQVGNEVSYNELAQTVGADKATVSDYIDLLEKAFVIFRLNPFARNLRNEISSTRKIYFYDNGVRNTIINNFAPVSQRNDIGALWENFIISERKKQLAYTGFYGNTYFWRNTARAEIDYIEEKGGKILAYELKWNPKAKVSFPKAFVAEYHPPRHRSSIAIIIGNGYRRKRKIDDDLAKNDIFSPWQTCMQSGKLGSKMSSFGWRR